MLTAATLTVLAMAAGEASLAADSSLVIEQVGNSQIASAQQSGAGNDGTIGQGSALADAGAFLDAIDDESTLATGGLLTTLGGGSAGNEAILRQAGSGHDGLILQAGYGNTATLEQSGTGQRGAIVQNGDNNSASVSQSGSRNVGAIFAYGNDNDAVLTQEGADNRGTISMTGSRNQARLSEMGDRNDASLTIVGNDNSYDLNIQGNDQQAFIKVTGDNVPLPLSSLTIRN